VGGPPALETGREHVDELSQHSKAKESQGYWFVNAPEAEMHIMHVIDGLALGGAERMLVDISSATAASGHRVSACVTRTCTDLAGSLDPRVQLYVLGRTRRFDIKALRRFARLVVKDQVSILQAHSRSTLAFLTVLKALGWLRAPVILQDHYGGIEVDAHIPLWFRTAGRFTLTRYVGVYQRLADWAIRAGVPTHRVSVLGNAIDLRRLEKAVAVNLREEFNLGAHCRVGVVVAGIRAEKGIDLLLHSLAIRPIPTGIQILIVGNDADPNYGRKCRELASQLRLQDTVQFVGRREDVPGLIKGADFALVPSRSESGPLVLIEYMAVGLPLVSTRVGDIAERAFHAGVPGIIAPGSVVEFRTALDDLLNLPSDRWLLRGDTGRKIAYEVFNISRVMPEWYKLYDKAVPSRHNEQACS
jgi:glycosyltransferase involved in cell wall biosynthesis